MMNDRGNWYYFKRTYRELSPSARKKLWGFAFATLIIAALESLVMGGIGALVAMLAAPEATPVFGYLGVMLRFVNNGELVSFPVAIGTLAAALLLLLLAKNIGTLLLSRKSASLAFSLEMQGGESLLSGFMAMPYQWQSKQNSSDLLQIFGWRRYLGKEFLIPCLALFSDFTMAVALLMGMLIISPILSGSLVLVLCLIGGGIFWFIKRKIDYHSKGFLGLHLLIARLASLTLHGAKDIKISGTETHFVQKLAENANSYIRHATAKVVLARASSIILETLGFGALMLFCVVLVFMPDSNSAHIAGFLAMIAAAAWRILPACNRIISSLAQLRNALPYLEQVYTSLDLIKEHGQPFGDTPPIPLETELSCQNVSFAYDGAATPALSGISLNIRRGESVGIIGASGAGKSTLVDILCGLQPCQSGAMLINRAVLDDRAMRGWRKSLGYVSQTPYIFDGTLAENVAFRIGDGIDHEQVRRACIQAVVDFVGELPQGYATPIGEKGTRLSGGQRQRVAIARALYRKPSVLIFDEATSALDNANERLIQNTIHALQGSLTIIIIAHRLSTVEQCDKIIWLDKGRVRMSGPAHKVIAAFGREDLAEGGGGAQE
jgi:ABC-type bacteriocin/lantibiotic exporters, contain an N-terminal double-glycine peptidase domain